jgi:dTDP-4-amino-4,6-dideoxygalactose transaminase
VLDPEIDRDRFRAVLAADGVQASIHYPPVHRFSLYAGDAPELPLTDAYAPPTVTLPIFAHMTDEQVELVNESALAAAA